MTPQEAGIRAARAAQLLADPLLVECLDLIEAECIAQWEAVPVRDTEGRELLWRFYKTAKKFRGILNGVVENGKLIAFREQEKVGFKDQALRMFRK